MAERFDPKFDILPQAQRDIWPALAPARLLSFVLYGGTAIALHLGHRVSVDFDFFSSSALDKSAIVKAFPFLGNSETIQEDSNTLIVNAPTKSGAVKLSFFGGLTIGHLNAPQLTRDGVLAVASREDLLATKLKAILDRAEAKDYRDIAALLSAGTPLEQGLAAFAKMFSKDAALPLRAIGYFEDGDLAALPDAEKGILRAARDRVTSIPDVNLRYGSLAGD